MVWAIVVQAPVYKWQPRGILFATVSDEPENLKHPQLSMQRYASGIIMVCRFSWCVVLAEITDK